MGEERSNETVHAISRNHSLNEINGYVDSFMWETIEKGVIEMIVQVKTIEETGTDRSG